ncbi:MAG: redoxin domain-containing protein [Thermoplasmata archaeon]|nr:redoxin domain-containing protein [Thermoplasmata archaeon]
MDLTMVPRDPATANPGQRRRWGWRIGAASAVALAIVIALAASNLLRPTGLPAARAGKPAPDIPVSALNGSASSLLRFQGHPLLLWWIATWCPSCNSGTQLFHQSYLGQFEAAGVNVLEIELYNNLGQPGPSLAQFAAQHGYANQSGWFFGTSSASATNLYDPHAETDVFDLIGSAGKVVETGSTPGGQLSSILSAATSA